MSLRTFFPVVVFTALAMSAVSCSDSGGSTTSVPVTKVRVGTVPFAGWGAIDVGIAKGFFKENGVDLEVVGYEGKDAELIADTIEGRNVDIGMYTVGTFQGPVQEAAKKVKWLGETDWSYGADQIIGRDPFEDQAIKDKTKKIGLYSKTPATSFFVERYLQDTDRHPGWVLSLKDSDVIEEEAAKMVDSFQNGTLGLSLNYEPYSTQQIEKGGKLLATSESYPGVIPNGVAMNADKYASFNKTVLTGFWKGWIKSIIWIFGKDNKNGLPDPANKVEFYNILRTKTLVSAYADSSKYTDADLDGFLKNARALNYNDFVKINSDPTTTVKIKDFTSKGVQPLRSHITEMSEFIVSLNSAAKPIDVPTFYDGKEVEAAISASK